MTSLPVTGRQRVETVFAGRKPDHTPVLGGWIACPEHIATLAEVTLDEYWADPFNVSVRAYEILGTDGLLSMFIPAHRSDYRCVDASSYAHAEGSMSLGEAVEYIDNMPTPEKIEADFDLAAAYENFIHDMQHCQSLCGDMLWAPAQWDAGACISWYGHFGYEQYFMIIGLYPDRAQKLMEIGGANGRNKGLIIAKAVEEGYFPKAVLMGEDICSQRGPMVSPKFMEDYYAPQLAYGLEPILAAGCKPVWHCDGHVQPMLDMLLDAGVQGFQGFQPECGMTIDFVSSMKTREGNKLLIFGPLAVTTELPVCTPEEIYAKTKYAIEICKDRADLCLFTANTINPDVPLENIKAMMAAAKETNLAD